MSIAKTRPLIKTLHMCHCTVVIKGALKLCLCFTQRHSIISLQCFGGPTEHLVCVLMSMPNQKKPGCNSFEHTSWCVGFEVTWQINIFDFRSSVVQMQIEVTWNTRTPRAVQCKSMEILSNVEISRFVILCNCEKPQSIWPGMFQLINQADLQWMTLNIDFGTNKMWYPKCRLICNINNVWKICRRKFTLYRFSL